MRGYLGVTAHYVEKGSLITKLLDCERFAGSHTGAHIADKFDTICAKCDIEHKIAYLVTDNASNMWKAFETAFPDVDAAANVVDEEAIWEGVEAAVIEVIQPEKERLSCFALTLQLVVHDELDAIRVMNGVMGKASRLTTILHTSGSFKEGCEGKFGKIKGIPQPNATRWNSTLRQIKAVLSLGAEKLDEFLIAQKQDHIRFTVREWSQLRELNLILSPFFEASDITQGDKVVTISAVVPSVLALHQHLEDHVALHLAGLQNELKTSLATRFRGILLRARLHPPVDVSSLPFGNYIYIVAAILDPAYYFLWIDSYMRLDVDNKEMKAMLSQMVSTLAGVGTPAPHPVPEAHPAEAASAGDAVDEDAASRKLFAGMRRAQAPGQRPVPEPVQQQFARYI